MFLLVLQTPAVDTGVPLLQMVVVGTIAPFQQGTAAGVNVRPTRPMTLAAGTNVLLVATAVGVRAQ